MAYRHVESDGSSTVQIDYRPVTITRYQPMERKY